MASLVKVNPFLLPLDSKYKQFADKLERGSVVDVLDRENKWCVAEVAAVKLEDVLANDVVTVVYQGWST